MAAEDTPNGDASTTCVGSDHRTTNASEDQEAAFCIGDDEFDAEANGESDTEDIPPTACVPSSLHAHVSSPKHLSLLRLAILTFYNVSGGPFGIEASVRAGGNLCALLGFLIGPLVSSVPEAGTRRDWAARTPRRAAASPGSRRPLVRKWSRGWIFGLGGRRDRQRHLSGIVSGVRDQRAGQHQRRL